MVVPILLLFLFVLTVCNAEDRSRLIPKLIWKTFEDPYSTLNVKFIEIFNKTLSDNPDYVQVYFDGKERDAFIAKYFPKYSFDYRSTVPGAYKSDIFNLIVLYRYGGIYNDLGLRYMQKISEVVNVTAEYVSAMDVETKWLFNGFTAVFPGHPLIKHMLITMMDNVHFQRYGCNHLDITGPNAITRMFLKYFHTPRMTFGTFVKHRGNLKFTLYSYFKNNTFYDYNNREVLRNKFEGYREAIYKNNSVSFTKLYEDHQVYLGEQPDNGKAAPPRTNFNGNVVKVKDKYYYILNGYRRAFPDQRTFFQMGFQECQLLNYGKDDSVILKLPEGNAFTANTYENHLQISSGVFAADYLNDMDAVVHKLSERVERFIAKNKGKNVLYSQFIAEVEGV